MEHFDVAIVGAGPAGSSAAIALARKGYSVALLDKEQFPREKLCGDFLNPVSWPLLRELNVERGSRALHQKVTTFRFTSFSGEKAEVPLPEVRWNRFRSRRAPLRFGLCLNRKGQKLGCHGSGWLEAERVETGTQRVAIESRQVGDA